MVDIIPIVSNHKDLSIRVDYEWIISQLIIRNGYVPDTIIEILRKLDQEQKEDDE